MICKHFIAYMYKEDLALNNQQWLICHKTIYINLNVCQQMTDIKLLLLHSNT